jgi:hypothetical protein
MNAARGCLASVVALFVVIVLVGIISAVVGGGGQEVPTYISPTRAVSEKEVCKKEASRWPAHCRTNGEVIWPSEAQVRHEQDVERETKEVEGVIHQRKAEETASILEGR